MATIAVDIEQQRWFSWHRGFYFPLANMPFNEVTKVEAKRKAHFACVVCKAPFVEVHHILPQAHGGSDDLENAAPLCAGCHDLFGGNPDKRKQIAQMRDFWYEICERRFQDSPSSQLNEAIDELKTEQREQGALLSGIKGLLEQFYTQQTSSIANATTVQQVACVSGVAIVNPSGAFGNGDMPEPPSYPTDDSRNAVFFGT
ncbi:MAG TPA: HNH endonuclease signature motif containing protein [Verrucomicrobiae bacterium]